MKASARKLLIEIPDYALGEQELWTPEKVKSALLDAHRMLRRTGGRVGPAAMRAHWPEYVLDQADFTEQSIAGTLKQHQDSVPVYRTRINATRMDMVLLGWKDADGHEQPSWLTGPLLAKPDIREKLACWVKAELGGETHSDLCYRKGWHRSTFVRHVTKAASVIADRLNRAGVEVW